MIKLRLLQLSPTMIAHGMEGRDVFLGAATLRPETMFGQTNCFILPGATYVCGEVLVLFIVNLTFYSSYLFTFTTKQMRNGEVLVVSERAMLNLSYQDHTSEKGVMNILCEVNGDELMGAPLSAPLSSYGTVYLLPLPTISMKKGTGIVTSVPSDAPDDFAMLRDIQQKEKIRSDYGISEEMVVPFDPVPVIQIPGYSNMAALDMVEKFKINSHKDKAQLAKAKDEVYLKGFYDGVMITNSEELDVNGKTVQEAKPIVRKHLVETGQALIYLEPEGMVISRSGDECVVALCEQYYLTYGEEEWRTKVYDHIHSDNFEANSQPILTQFDFAVDWLKEWACSRQFGLGTQLPGSEEEWVIESLSDSTIYMAFYTISALLQGEDNLDGSEENPIGISVEDINDSFFDYIFFKDTQEVLERGEFQEMLETTVSMDKLDQLKEQFRYWYPLDLRVSGKDLIPNHLTMSLYNHSAIWEDEPEMWPRSFYANGHVLVDSDKMSKSTGNFFMLFEVCDKFGADAARFSLAEAGDSLVDANFVTDVVNAGFSHISSFSNWIKHSNSLPLQ